eukprot:999962-Pelagomonas_calceolata.AAC.1
MHPKIIIIYTDAGALARVSHLKAPGALITNMSSVHSRQPCSLALFFSPSLLPFSAALLPTAATTATATCLLALRALWGTCCCCYDGRPIVVAVNGAAAGTAAAERLL